MKWLCDASIPEREEGKLHKIRKTVWVRLIIDSASSQDNEDTHTMPAV